MYSHFDGSTTQQIASWESARLHQMTVVFGSTYWMLLLCYEAKTCRPSGPNWKWLGHSITHPKIDLFRISCFEITGPGIYWPLPCFTGRSIVVQTSKRIVSSMTFTTGGIIFQNSHLSKGSKNTFNLVIILYNMITKPANISANIEKYSINVAVIKN